MGNSNDTIETKSTKCKDCYYEQECMLTPFMARVYCGGPWENKAEHIKFIKEVIPLIMPKKHGK